MAAETQTMSSMGKAVFVSHSAADSRVALEVCSFLEAQGIDCWIAPRDVEPGSAFEEQILAAITHSQAIVLVLSASSNESPFVKNEVNRAFAQRKPIFTLRAEDVMPSGSLELYLASHHWVDGFPPPITERLPRFAAAISALLGRTALSGFDGGVNKQQVVVSESPREPSLPAASSAPMTGASSKGLPSTGRQVQKRRASTDLALLEAIVAPNEAMVATLISGGANPNATDGSGTPALIHAINLRHLGIMNTLLNGGADVNAQDNYQVTALITAAGNCELSVIEDLMSRGANVRAANSQGLTALHMALGATGPRREGVDVSIVRKLVESGADVNADWIGTSPLTLAVRALHDTRWRAFETAEQLVTILVDAGARLNHKDRLQGRTALMELVDFTDPNRHNNYAGIADMLIKAGADVNTCDNLGRTALMFAARSGQDDVIRLFLSNGAHVDAEDHDGKDAFVYSANARESTMNLLRQALDDDRL